MAVAVLIRNVGPGSDPTSISNITLVAPRVFVQRLLMGSQRQNLVQ